MTRPEAAISTPESSLNLQSPADETTAIAAKRSRLVKRIGIALLFAGLFAGLAYYAHLRLTESFDQRMDRTLRKQGWTIKRYRDGSGSYLSPSGVNWTLELPYDTSGSANFRPKTLITAGKSLKYGERMINVHKPRPTVFGIVNLFEVPQSGPEPVYMCLKSDVLKTEEREPETVQAELLTDLLLVF